MITETITQFEEKRFALRMALRLPIVFSGRAADSAAWSEPTETDDISTAGTLFHLNQTIAPGKNLYLRSHRPDSVPVEVKARVMRVAAAFGTTRVASASLTEKKTGFVFSPPGLPTTRRLWTKTGNKKDKR